MKSLEEPSEREMQAARNAQEMASFLKIDMSEATSACDFWKERGRQTRQRKGGVQFDASRRQLLASLFFLNTCVAGEK